MKTLRFYRVMNNELVEIDYYTKENSYSVNYYDWPEGTFYTVLDSTNREPADLYPMFTTATKIDYNGYLYIIECPGGGKDVIRVEVNGKVELIPIDAETVGVVCSLLQTYVFDNIKMNELTNTFLRKGVDGVCETIIAATFKGLRKLP